MKKLGIFVTSLLLTVSFFSCNKSKTENSDNVYGGGKITSVKNMSVDTLSIRQLDSLTKADHLPSYSKWDKTYFKDDESYIQYEYATIMDNTSGIIYTVKYLKNKQKYVVQKRKTTHK